MPQGGTWTGLPNGSSHNSHPSREQSSPRGNSVRIVMDSDLTDLRYLYRYIEEKGAMDRLREMGIQDEDIVRIKKFEFEYYE